MRFPNYTCPNSRIIVSPLSKSTALEAVQIYTSCVELYSDKNGLVSSELYSDKNGET